MAEEAVVGMGGRPLYGLREAVRREEQCGLFPAARP